jgi:hypothetical protein
VVIAMKKSILALLLVSTCAFAAEDVGSKGTITVKLANGKTMTYAADQYRVIKRGFAKPKAVAKAQPAPKTITIQHVLTKFVEIMQPQPEPKRNRVRLMGGVGPNGVNVEGGPAEYTVSAANKLVAGVGYNRLLTDRWSVDAQALTNKTFTLGLGFDF